MESLDSGRWEVRCRTGERVVLDNATGTWNDDDREGQFHFTRTDRSEKTWTSAVEAEVGLPLYVYDAEASDPVWASRSAVTAVRRLDS